MPDSPASLAFAFKDCALAAIGTARRAKDLRELRDQIQAAHPGCIYYHFWGILMRPQFENPEYINDFAEWTSRALHDKVLAERLGVIDPADSPDIEDLRKELVEVIEQRLDELEVVPWSRPDAQFHFTRAQLLVLDTRQALDHPSQMAAALEKASIGTIFYHFVDGRQRHEDNIDDFRAWLSIFGDEFDELSYRIAQINPYFSSLTYLRTQAGANLQRLFQRG